MEFRHLWLLVDCEVVEESRSALLGDSWHRSPLLGFFQGVHAELEFLLGLDAVSFSIISIKAEWFLSSSEYLSLMVESSCCSARISI